MTNIIESDIDYYGPGIWTSIHLICMDIHLKTRTKIDFIRFCQTILPCEKCRHHCSDYLLKHSPSKYLIKTDSSNIRDPNNSTGQYDTQLLSRWSWKFHNVVNNRKNKKLMKYDVFQNYYRDFVIDRKTGSGMWYIIHLVSLSDFFTFNTQCSIVRSLVDSTRCTGKQCELNKRYMIKYRPENYKDDLYRWSYLFHNEINIMLNKSTPDYFTSKTSFSNYINNDRVESCENCRVK